ncbi:BTAD domain-containing putative transcriptional regulator [Streptomyces sp. JJ38]|uniref:AfsR/SARP family transcriptional regulator n=1 Tax=Streptomyces sp. JJ38 TaxID=2738128 RepID=UPI0027E19FEE|nr:BTAD domain-containing putative transcriptional regulator [Streptomyces sp. JJ38]
MTNAVGTLRIQLLGPVRAWWDGQEVAAGPPKQRALLSLLASRAGEAVGREAVIEALWGGDAPHTAANGVHTYVAGLRRALEPRIGGRNPNTVLTSEPGGYCLRVHPDAVDAAAFVQRHGDARRSRDRGDTAVTAGLYEEALALWKGDAFSGIPGPFAALEGARLRDVRLTAVEEWGAVMVEAGRHGEAVGALSRAAAEEPLRERLRWLLMLALWRGGRQGDSLRLYAETRRLLRGELGVEPGPELRDLHQQILEGRVEPAARRTLATPAAADTGWMPVARGAVAPALPRPAQLPPGVSTFTGRERELEQLEGLVGADRCAAGPAATVVVVQGLAGVGKSALVLRLAHTVSDRFPDGQVYVDLGGSGLRGRPLSAADAQRQVLTSLGVDGGRVPRDLVGSTALYRSLLYDRRMLVVLDDALSADQIRPLIPRGPAGVVVTSRQRFAGLAARDGAHTVTLGPLDEDAATLLLTTLTDGRLVGRVTTARRLAALCGGLPLALRVLAERLTGAAGEPPELLLERCAPEPGRLDCLTVPDDALADVWSAFEASYQVLPAEAARMFRHLGMYRRGRITVRGAAALAGTDAPTARALLDVLVDAHLIEERGPRYRLPELLGIYAAECARRESAAVREAALARLDALAPPPRPRASAAHGPRR